MARIGTIPVIDLDGDLDVVSNQKLKDAIHELLDQGHANIILNLRNLSYMDSSGLGVLIASFKRVREQNGSISLISPSNMVERLLELTQLNQLFPIYSTEQQALDAVAAR